MRRLSGFLAAVVLTMALMFGVATPLVRAQAEEPSSNSAIEDPFEQNCTGAAATSSSFCKSRTEEAANRKFVFGDGSLLVRIAQFIVLLTGVVSVIMIIIGGFRYVISNGDANSMKGAKDTVLYAVVGLVIAVLSQFIVSYVLTRFI